MFCASTENALSDDMISRALSVDVRIMARLGQDSPLRWLWNVAAYFDTGIVFPRNIIAGERQAAVRVVSCNGPSITPRLPFTRV